jgi:hypothetical protein
MAKYLYDTGTRERVCLERFEPQHSPDGYTFTTPEDVEHCIKWDGLCSGTFTEFSAAKRYALYRAKAELLRAQEIYDEIAAMNKPCDVPIETDPYH